MVTVISIIALTADGPSYYYLLHLEPCDTTKWFSQKWILEKEENSIVLKDFPHLVIDAYSTRVDGNVGLWTHHGNLNQQWTISNISENDNNNSFGNNYTGNYTEIRDSRSTLCVGINSSSDNLDGEPIKLTECNGSDKTLWLHIDNLLRSKFNSEYCITIENRYKPLYLKKCNKNNDLQLCHPNDNIISWTLESSFVMDAYGVNISC